MKPFGVSTDLDGRVWVADNISSTVSVLSSAGELIATLPSTFQGRTVLSHPSGTPLTPRETCGSPTRSS